MKIGILTVPFNNNYGGFLQAFALKRVLESMGHKVIIINRQRNGTITLRSILGDLLRGLHLLEDKQKKLSKYTDQFQKKYLFPYTKKYYSSQELKRCVKYKFDAVIVGSDQVWRYWYFKDWIDDFFCNFLEGTNISHFSYAASMGSDEMDYPQDKIEICSRLLKDFKAISVREESSVKLLKEYFGVENVQVVLDPTFLLDRQAYIDLFKDKYTKPENPYIFTYVLDDDDEIKQSIEDFSHKMNMPVLNIKAETGDISEIAVIEPVEKWLSAICYADYVITDSFHGTVFSLIFNKQFVVYGNVQRGMSRMQDLLNRVGLQNRLITSNSGVSTLLEQEIDWVLVNKQINIHIDSSMAFLDEAMKF
ncbi:polysaccharide pyruvyl transferase family protein [Prevotella sp. P6B4]|uniref:polysaccharide pyruvyl transferase family protein n=1 Tax=Prevotella sp. P6B4 TaxID=1410614 RepID=UPI00048CABAD|nr:polysaccharide pyruvyl transferase family protein [Prevotella sp. P6B4]